MTSKRAEETWTSRCDGAVVYERPEERRAARAANQRADRYARNQPDERNRGSAGARGPGLADNRIRSRGCD